jgi:hypothetical protein
VHLRTLICRVDPRTPASAVTLFSPSGGAEGAADAGTVVDAAVATFTEPISANGVATTTATTTFVIASTAAQASATQRTIATIDYTIVAFITNATNVANAANAANATTADADTASFAERGRRLAIADAGITVFTATTIWR